MSPQQVQASDLLPLLPSPDWCTDGVPTEVASFTFHPPLLIGIREDDVCPEDPMEPREGECGQFDDDYSIGEKSAVVTCARFARRQLVDSDIGSVIAVATGPAEFLDVLHRDRFRVTMGLSGICVRCEPRPVSPVSPAPPPR